VEPQHRADAALAHMLCHNVVWLRPPTGGVWLRIGDKTSADVSSVAMRFRGVAMCLLEV
jgi:hypothetical protein